MEMFSQAPSADISPVVRERLSGSMLECLRNCVECQQTCEAMVMHCLEKGGRHADPRHIRLLQDCAQICGVAADFMVRDSYFHQLLCGGCAGICQRLAAECDALAEDDPTMAICAEICRRCEESCTAMSQVQ